jgi:hypothetical protein
MMISSIDRTLEKSILGRPRLVEDVAAMYAPDGMRMPPNAAAVTGRKWISVGRKVSGQWMTVSDIWNSDRPLPTR